MARCAAVIDGNECFRSVRQPGFKRHKGRLPARRVEGRECTRGSLSPGVNEVADRPQAFLPWLRRSGARAGQATVKMKPDGTHGACRIRKESTSICDDFQERL